MSATVQAAGGVLWRPRPGGDGIEVAVVHRPRYDDWSLPKGKLAAGEAALTAAVREVREETGSGVVVGRTLGRSRYRVLQDGRELPKTVRWWAMRAAGGEFEPSDEVDELRWLPPGDAEDLLTAGRDLAPLRLLVEQGLGTRTVLLVRHAHAGDRASWDGEDLQRPLDDRGTRQAAALADLLRPYAPVRVLSAPALRCVQTVEPLAAEGGLAVEVEPSVGEVGWALDAWRAVRLLRTLADDPDGNAVVCSQRGPLPQLVSDLAGEDGYPLPGALGSRKGSTWALTFSLGGALVDADHLEPPA